LTLADLLVFHSAQRVQVEYFDYQRTRRVLPVPLGWSLGELVHVVGGEENLFLSLQRGDVAAHPDFMFNI
jgi:hypothetical protein